MKIRKKEDKANRTTAYLGVLLVTIILLTLTVVGLRQTDLWFNYNEIKFQKLDVAVQYPRVWVEEREPEVMYVPIVSDIQVETPIQEKICEAFGDFNCKEAIEVMKCESGERVDVLTPEPNGTISAGLFQINSIHWDRFGGVVNLLNEDGNIAAAKEIWEEQGWGPWTCAHLLTIAD